MSEPDTSLRPEKKRDLQIRPDCTDAAPSSSDNTDHNVETGTRLPTHFPFFRSTFFQILVVGVCAFSAPGIWTAMNGLGVGGSQSPDLVNAANAILYAFMTVTCFSGPLLTNLIGFRWTLALGSIGYPLYAAGLYVNNRYGTTWFVYVGAVACGISAGFFWSVEGAISTGYPESHKRGRYIAIWSTFRNLGNLVGGSISLALNVHTQQTGQVSYQTYLAFIGIQCIGFAAGLLLSNPEKIRRDDGTCIEAPRGVYPVTEIKALSSLALTKPILLLAPLFWYYGWLQAYPGTYLATYFTIRSRSRGSLVAALAATLGAWTSGLLLDTKWSKDRRTRALVCYSLMLLINTATWIWGVIVQNEYRYTHPVLDWARETAFAGGFGFYVLYRIAEGMVENYIYWCISNLSDSPGDQIRYSSLLRGIETAGVALSFGVQAISPSLIVTAALNLGFWCLALPFSYVATLQVVSRFRQLNEEKLDDVGVDGSWK